jgi:thiamine biosynthesis lipoprotein
MMNLLQPDWLASDFVLNPAKTPVSLMPAELIQLEHQAMATRWRCWLTGADRQHLSAVGNWWVDELERWDRLLSKFDPASEVTRLNRAPVGKPCKVGPELFELLNFCEQAKQATHGIFDVTASSFGGQDSVLEDSAAPYQLDHEQCLFRWSRARRQLDFGGVAKGYVLDQLAPALREHGVQAALLDAGGSSLLTWDGAGDDTSWQVSLAPANEDPSRRLLTVADIGSELPARPLLQFSNSALSYSATRHAGATTGQTIDPRWGTNLPEERACVVLTDSAAWAEVLSTAALCMGEAAAAKYIKEEQIVSCRLGWIEGADVRWHNTPV